MDKNGKLMSARAVHDRMKRDEPAFLLDVRSATEYAQAHAVGALSMPLEQLSGEELTATLGPAAGRKVPVHLICASGQRANTAASLLGAQGLTNLAVVDGGTDAWAAQRLPLRRTSTLPSLVRQTQIAVGVLLLLMLVKGALLHPLFYVLIGLVASGLIVAGLTGSCGLAALLARMPWNRPSSGNPATPS